MRLGYNDGRFNEDLLKSNVEKIKEFGEAKKKLEAFDEEALFTRKVLENEVGFRYNHIPGGDKLEPACKENFKVNVCGEEITAVRYLYSKPQLIEFIDKTIEECQRNIADMVSYYDARIEEVDNQIKALEEKKAKLAETKKFIDEVGIYQSPCQTWISHP